MILSHNNVPINLHSSLFYSTPIIVREENISFNNQYQLEEELSNAYRSPKSYLINFLLIIEYDI